MDAIRRLFPYIWPQKRRLAWSVIFGVLVAAFWGLDLLAAKPLLDILTVGSPHVTIPLQIAEASKEIDDRTANIAELDRELETLKQENAGHDDPRVVEATQKRVNNQAKRTDAEWVRYRLHWIQRVVLPWTPVDTFHYFAMIIGLLLLGTAIKGIFIYLQDVLIGDVAERALMNVRKKLLRKILNLDYQTLSAEGTGGLMSRFTYDTEQLATGVTLLGGKLVREPLKCLACAVMALFLNWRLTLLALACVPLLALAFGKFGRLLKRASKRMMESMSRIYKVLEETFDGLKVVIAFDAGSKHRRAFNDEYRRYYGKAMRLVRIDAVAKPTMELLGMMALCLALLPGAYLVLRGETSLWGIRLSSGPMDVATLGTLYAMLAGMLDPCRKMSTTYSRLKKSTAAMERVFAMIDATSKVQEPANAQPLPRLSQAIEFKDVCFGYTARQAAEQRGLVLDHFNLKVDAGEVIAIVGHNGCGKSTLMQLLPRFFDPTSGEVYLDGLSLREVKLADLRRQIGVVTQDTVLFDDSIYENIRYGRPDATRKEIEEAARQAHVMPIVDALPQGFEARVGEKGRTLSGGQRQRIALARAILRDPAVMILDEATSAADAESEALIHKALKEFAPGRTMLLISHTMSASLLDFVTRIVVMEDGRVLATGRHEDLLRTCSVYQRLYTASSRKMLTLDSPPFSNVAPSKAAA
ncbi:ABC transporter ATP-binding protein [Caulifigura coniformis]|uniref:ABC transporter ATP-binding protein n=1 Tax=Caulifigura coniformis TaxID=2527983 RepID=UPI0018D26802|nr:ABC transporter ATP-binding protein [Caulifigura coniformis]